MAVYAGTFDPPTLGHLWMIEQGAKLFDGLSVAVGVNPSKRCMFSIDERVAMLEELTKGLTNVQVDDMALDGFLVDYASGSGALFIFRGIRSQDDYDYERIMRNANGDSNSNITTVFLMPPRELADISSSLVKGFVGPKGWEKMVKRYVPESVFKKIKEAHDARRA
ncbi:MAG: pantetheine-phosphate adenylyltransferase [bacterium]|nr:pantetheine-phosphate adenylyltransferase [bacterium]